MTAAPDYDQWSRTITDSHLPQDICSEAIGYARSHCDVAHIGSGDAINFGLTFAVLVAQRSSRPPGDCVRANWCAGPNIVAPYPVHPVFTPPTS